MIKQIEVYRRSSGWQKNRPGHWADIWVHVSPGYIYLSYRPGRSYWVLSNIERLEPEALPRITFREDSLVMAINTYRVRFLRKTDFDYARKTLADYAS